jgi:hypothetical protein
VSQDPPLPPLPPPPVPPQAQPVLPYATPIAHQGQGIWREGSKLVVTKQVELPDACVKCNAPADGWVLRKTLYWHSPLFYLLIVFPGLLIYAIVALVVRQKAVVAAGLCPAHRARRHRTIFVAWLVALLGIAALFAGFGLTGDRDTELLGGLCVFGGLLMIIAGGAYGVIWGSVLSPTKMQGNYAWLKGAGNDFLANFPPTGQ